MEAGTKLGHYEILEPLGAGGMGQVYRARDTTLDRDVAIKVLPEDFASDANRLARFEREAKLLASLNHPNIATIFGFEESDGVRFIAMELVEGQSLAERITTSGRIEVDEALEIARQIALALEAATRPALSIGISNPPTSRWHPMAPSRCWISGWPKPTKWTGANRHPT